MSMEKYEKLVKKDPTKTLWGLFLKEGEKSKLYDICIKYNIPITYPNLFTDDSHYFLWGINKNGIGLIGTIIMNYLSNNNGKIFNTLYEFEEYLERMNN